jgi:hypothetical protein
MCVIVAAVDVGPVEELSAGCIPGQGSRCASCHRLHMYRILRTIRCTMVCVVAQKAGMFSHRTRCICTLKGADFTDLVVCGVRQRAIEGETPRETRSNGENGGMQMVSWAYTCPQTCSSYQRCSLVSRILRLYQRNI